MTTPATLTPLPHWETIPADVPAAIVEVKRELRERIASAVSRLEQLRVTELTSLLAAVGPIPAAGREGTAAAALALASGGAVSKKGPTT